MAADLVEKVKKTIEKMQMYCGALITENGIGIWDGWIFGLGEVENTLTVVKTASDSCSTTDV